MSGKRNVWIAGLVIALVLVAAFFVGGAGETKSPAQLPYQEITADIPAESETETESPSEENGTVEVPEEMPEIPSETEEQTQAEKDTAADITEEPKEEVQPEQTIDTETGKDAYQTDPVPEGKPVPVEPQETVVGEDTYTCIISISCATMLDNMDACDPDKIELIPADGWLLQPVQVTFYEGESVFNILQRICKQNKIHMEYMDTPIYNSAYIEGIGNLYEFDAGELSGWMYSVNGWYPNYGCSRYALQNGDIIEWKYTCDQGTDIGGNYVANNKTTE